jgi:hypothetical protein
MLLEEMLVIDAATLYPRYNRGGSLYALDIIDGATIQPLIGEDGRAPEPPDPAYQQILKGIGDDAVDPLEQAQTLQILVGAGIKTREEARADLGLAPVGGKRRAPPLTDPCASADAPPRANAKPSVSAV